MRVSAAALLGRLCHRRLAVVSGRPCALSPSLPSHYAFPHSQASHLSVSLKQHTAVMHSSPSVPNLDGASSNARPMHARMTQKLTSEFSPAYLKIADESRMHAEHEAMRDNGFNETHFNIVVVSEKFHQKMPVQRHRMVYALLEDEFKQGLHAVNITARTPAEHERITQTSPTAAL